MIKHCRGLHQRIRKKCDSMDTDPALRDTLLQGLESCLECRSNPFHFPNLVQQKDALGWHQLLQGRFHLDWNHHQLEFSKHSNSKGHHESNWTVSTMHSIWQWTHECWTIRNTTRHGKEQQSFELREKEKAVREVSFLHGLEKRTRANDREIFTTPLDEQLEANTTSLIDWTIMWRPVILHSLNRAATLAMTHVRLIRDHFKPP